MNPMRPILRFLIQQVTQADRTNEVEGDLQELYHRVSGRRGKIAASLCVVKEIALLALWRLRPRHRARVSKQRGPSVLTDSLRDTRIAARALRRSPLYTLAAVVLVGLGVGANTTMFSIINSLFLTPPPALHEPERLVRLARDTGSRLTGSFGYPDYEFFRDESDVFTGLAGYSTSPIALSIGTGTATVQADAWAVSGSYFDVLGVTPRVGRLLQPDDDRAGSDVNVAVLSSDLWQRQFGGREEVIGTSVRLNGQPFVILGILPEAFRGLSPVLEEPDVYIPLHARPLLLPGTGYQFVRTNGMLSYWIRIVGRLAPGVDVATARANIDVLNGRWSAEFESWITATDPDTLRAAVWQLPQYDPNHAARLSRIVWLLAGVVGSVLLVAIANLAILQLARASSQQRDIAIRAALGAGRRRLIRQLLAESLLVAMLGGLLGFGAAFWTADAVASLLPFSFTNGFRPDLTVLLVTFGLAAGTGILFGSAPAWHITRRSVVDVMKKGGSARRLSLTRETLVVFQIAMSVVLLSAAGVFLQSLRNAYGTDLGFGPSEKLFLQVRLDSHGYDEARGLTFLETALDRLAVLPGVDNVTAASRKPLRTMAFGDFTVDERQESVSLGFHRAASNHFETFEIPISVGRGITRNDRSGTTPVVVVNTETVRRHFDGNDPLGKTLTYENGVQYTIVGVVGNAEYHSIGGNPTAHAYVPFEQNYGSSITLVIRTNRDPWLVAGPAQEVLRDVDPNIAVFGVESFRDIVRDETGQYRATAMLVSIFGVVALVLASVGVYGVQSYLVALNRREICVRIALGAGNRRVASRVVGRGLRLGLIGTGLGIAVALVGARWVEHLLFGVAGRDPVVLTLAPMTLIAVLTVASLVPARRASSLDPMMVLREE